MEEIRAGLLNRSYQELAEGPCVLRFVNSSRTSREVEVEVTEGTGQRTRRYHLGRLSGGLVELRPGQSGRARQLSGRNDVGFEIHFKPNTEGGGE